MYAQGSVGHGSTGRLALHGVLTVVGLEEDGGGGEGGHTFRVLARPKSVTLAACNAQERSAWVDAFRKALAFRPSLALPSTTSNRNRFSARSSLPSFPSGEGGAGGTRPPVLSLGSVYSAGRGSDAGRATLASTGRPSASRSDSREGGEEDASVGEQQGRWAEGGTLPPPQAPSTWAGGARTALPSVGTDASGHSGLTSEGTPQSAVLGQGRWPPLPTPLHDPPQQQRGSVTPGGNNPQPRPARQEWRAAPQARGAHRAHPRQSDPRQSDGLVTGSGTLPTAWVSKAESEVAAAALRALVGMSAESGAMLHKRSADTNDDDPFAGLGPF